MSDQPFSAELVPFPLADRLPGIPSPAEVHDLVAEQFNRAVQRERDERGRVEGPETVAPMVRAVEGFRGLMGDYQRAFSRIADTAKAVLEEELFEAQGEQDGIPMGALAVPAADGSGSVINVKAKTANRHDIDRDTVIAALAVLVSEEWAADPVGPAVADAPEEFAIAVAGRALDMVGAQSLKVTQVRALATSLGQISADKIAAMVLGAITTTRIYQGVDVTRKAS